MAVNDDEVEGGSGRRRGEGGGVVRKVAHPEQFELQRRRFSSGYRGPTKRILTPTGEAAAVFTDVVPVREVSECSLRKDVIVAMLQLCCRELQQKRKRKKKTLQGLVPCLYFEI